MSDASPSPLVAASLNVRLPRSSSDVAVVVVAVPVVTVPVACVDVVIVAVVNVDVVAVEGDTVGGGDGTGVGAVVGASDGTKVGVCVGIADGDSVGLADGAVVGSTDGATVGADVGASEHALHRDGHVRFVVVVHPTAVTRISHPAGSGPHVHAGGGMGDAVGLVLGARDGAALGASVHASQKAGHEGFTSEVQPNSSTARRHSEGSGPHEHVGVGPATCAMVGAGVSG